MSGLFLKLLNMSISASVLIVVVVLARCLLRKSPKWIHCILWALVGIRLLCPFQLETTFSLAPNAQVVSIEAGAVTSQVLAEMPALDNTANRYLAKYYFEGITIPEQETAQNPMNLIASIWLCGVAVLLVYAAVSYVHIRRKVRESVRIEGNIYICDRIQTPFIFGVLNPRIYLPSSLKEVQIKNVVAHEKAHIRRLDYLWKPLGYVLFAVYWFNPFCWLAYILFCRDIEMACDERVIKDWSAEQKKEYSLVLLSFHVPGKMITVCPLAFGEVGVKQRVKGILNFKKPTFWLIAAALLFCVIIGALFLTNPKKNDNVEENIATELSESSLTDQTLNTEKDSLADQESELNALLKKQSDAIRAQQQSFLQTWADAFCDRDGAAIDSLCMDGARKKMMKEQLLVIDEGDTIFGWSSPWPMWDTSDENSKGYTITTSYDGKNTAEILYYAWTSDPHVTVWKEDITFEERDGSYKVTDENIRFLDYIVSGTEFDEAYPQINGTPIDYTVNGMYDALVMNSLLSSSMLYQNLKDPVLAAKYLLNLLDNENKVQVEALQDGSKEGINIKITFIEDGAERFVKMIQPDSEDVRNSSLLIICSLTQFFPAHADLFHMTGKLPVHMIEQIIFRTLFVKLPFFPNLPVHDLHLFQELPGRYDRTSLSLCNHLLHTI